jgi:hypothetical protein
VESDSTRFYGLHAKVKMEADSNEEGRKSVWNYLTIVDIGLSI